MTAPLGMAPIAPPRQPVRGFVLVGVVMMVLALTILGLSLFSLSSYEAQFMNRSLDEAQAMHYAAAGLDRARFALLVPPDSLAFVKRNLPFGGVYYARATQLKGLVYDSMGVFIPGGNPIQIEVAASHRGVTRWATGTYGAQGVGENWYHRLFTIAAGGITVNQKSGPAASRNCNRTSILTDSVWVDQASLTWTTHVAPLPPSNYGVNRKFVATPTVGPFLTSHSATATPVPHGTPVYSLIGSPGVIRYWYTDNLGPTGGYNFSSYNSTPATINVSGRAVWLLPKGLRVDNLLTINGNPATDCLVIVAQNGADANPGGGPGAVWFFGGVISNIPVILATDGEVKLEHFYNHLGFSRIDHLSVYANSLLLTGPEEASPPPQVNFMQLSYGAAVMDPLIDALMAAGALPNSVALAPLTLVPGTWRLGE